MIGARSIPTASDAAALRQDSRVIISGVTWGRYVAIRELLDDHPGLRMTYLEGVLEITSPSPEHERRKSIIGRLIEMYAVEKRVPLNAYGSTTFRKARSFPISSSSSSRASSIAPIRLRR